jgi:hypothetical protein
MTAMTSGNSGRPSRPQGKEALPLAVLHWIGHQLVAEATGKLRAVRVRLRSNVA